MTDARLCSTNYTMRRRLHFYITAIVNNLTVQITATIKSVYRFQS